MHAFLRAAVTALVPAFALAACGGGGGSTPPAASPAAANLQSLAMLEPKTTAVSRIFVAQFQAFDIDLFDATGKLLGQASGIDGPQNIVLDKAKTLFVADFGADEILSYTKDLQQNSAIVHLSASPVGLAVGASGKLFVTLYPSGTVVAYDRNGMPATPTITGPGNVTYVAVDPAGKIYVTDSAHNVLRTYRPDGTATTPTITAGLNGPGPIVIDKAGKIYVGNSGGGGSITTYTSAGKRVKPTIAVKGPHGLSVAANGNIYVTDSVDSTALAFAASGAPIAPVISGLNSPTGIAAY